MKIYRIDDQSVFADKELSVGELLTPNTTDGAHEKKKISHLTEVF